MIIWGEQAGFAHEANGMTLGDIRASSQVATDLDEIIIYRSSGPWCKRWIDWKHPTKNFHVKGKSSDWGPHAGLVPYDGIYSKVGAYPAKALAGTHKNDEGLASGFAGKTQLRMKRLEIAKQATVPEGGKTAVLQVMELSNSRDLMILAARSGAGSTRVIFRAVYSRVTNDYAILVWPFTEALQNPFQVAQVTDLSRYRAFEVMTSAEVGANNKPLTGDYDLMAVCPTWAQYGSKSTRLIGKAGIHLENGTLNKGVSFQPGVGMDNVMDTRFHTMGNRQPGFRDFHDRQKHYRQQERKYSDASAALIADDSRDREHQDMGNLTPRILRCINALNEKMGAVGAASALRRVHHNAESHRNRKWAALTEADMLTPKDGDKFGDGFPMTAFHPARMVGAGYFQDQVCTIETLAEFRDYAAEVKNAGFYMPKNWIWNM